MFLYGYFYEVKQMESHLKLRIYCAIFLLAGFLFCKYNAYEIFSYSTAEIIDMIEYNQYDGYELFRKDFDQ